MANTPTTNYAYLKPASGDTGWGTTMNTNLDSLDEDMQGMAQLAGRAGGQTLYGGTAANEDLILHGTSNSTRTTSYVLLQPTAGNVGIGTTAPDGTLEVNLGTSGQFRLTYNDANGSAANYAKMEVTASGGLTITTVDNVGASGHVLLIPDGSVGIGSASFTPQGGLMIDTADSAVSDGVTQLILSDNTPLAADTGGGIVFRCISSGTTRSSIAAIKAGKNNATESDLDSYLAFYTRKYGGTFGERVRINPDGNVGIGTTAPYGALQINSATHVLQFYETDGTADKRMYGWAMTGDELLLTARNDAGASVRTIMTWEHDGNTLITSTASGANLLGVGLTSPDSKLHVSVETANTSTVQRLVSFSANSTGTAAAGFGSRILWELESSTTNDQTAAALDVQWSDATHATRTSYIALSTVNSAAALAERVRITGAGNVGIGTTAPGVKLDVVDTTSITTFTGTNAQGLRITGSTSVDRYSMLQFSGNGQTTPLAQIGVKYTGSGSLLQFGTSNLYASGITNTAMTIDYSGNVGIATTSPGGKLDISSGVIALIVGADSGAITRTNTTTKYSRIGAYHYTNAEEPVAIAHVQSDNGYNLVDIGGATSSMNAATYLRFWTAANGTTVTGTERMRIDNTGNVGIGTTAPTHKLHVNTGTDQNFKVRPHAYGTGSGIMLQASNDAADATVPMEFGALSYSFNVGRVGIGTTAPETLLHVGSTAKISGFAAHILAESNASSTASGIIVQADAQTDGAYMTLVTRGAVGGTGGGAAIAMYDGATTFQSGSLTYAGGNSSGSRYLGILAGKDRDGNYIPLRFFSTDAGGTSQDGIFLQGGQTAGRAGFVGVGTISPDSALHLSLITGNTNAVRQAFTISTNSAGTAAAGFGSRILWELESSTTDDQTAALLDIVWAEATHATRKARAVLSVYDTAVRECMRAEASGTAAMVGFLGANASARLAHVADPAGGATVDAEARSAINSILTTLETFGFHASS